MHENGRPYNIITDALEGTVEVKKSVFIGELRNVRSEEEAKEFLEEVRKKYRDAGHHCFAMRLGEPGSEFEKSSDDGEPQGTAGKPILTFLKGEDLYDVCGVVTRYFGGTLLGTGGLSRAYSDSIREAFGVSVKSELYKGRKVHLKCDYQLSNRIKYLSQTMEIYTEKEEYSDVCDLYYLVEEEKFPVFSGKVTEMSGGKVVPLSDDPLYFYKDQKPVVYKML